MGASLRFRTWPVLSSLSLAVASSLHAADIETTKSTIPPSIAAQLDVIRAQARLAWSRSNRPAPPHTPGTVLQVTSCADNGQPGTLRSVVASAQTGDTVSLAELRCTKIVLTQGYVLDNYQVSSFFIQGPGQNLLTISGGGTGGVFYHAGNGQLSISDLSIADGRAEDAWGGCLIAPSGGFDLTRVMVSGCEAHQATMLHGSNAMGGGVMAFGELNVVESIISSNTLFSDLPDAGSYSVGLSGGGAFSLTGPLSITKSIIANNTIVSFQPIQGEMHGSGAGSLTGAVTVTDSVVSGNSLNSGFADDSVYFSRLSGAGLSAESGDLTVVDSTIDANSIHAMLPIARVYGAGIFFAGNTAAVSGSTISNNYSIGLSAGICDHGFSMSVSDSTISGNHAVGDFGGLYAVGTLQVGNSTIAFNISGAGTGGLATYAVTTLQSTIVASNEGVGSPDVEELGHGSIGGDHDFVGVQGSATLPADTLFGDPQLEPLADNGGPTRTHALAASSLAIDAGSNPLGLEFDQRGDGFPRVNGAAADIGAYESGVSNSDTIFANGFDS